MLRNTTRPVDCNAIIRMTNSSKVAIGIIFAIFKLGGEPLPHTYTGNIVNAKCMPATEIVSRNSRGYTPAGVNAYSATQNKPLNTRRLKKTILKRCAVHAGVTEFALLESGGNFFRLDDTGNRQVVASSIRITKDRAVTIRGNVDRATLNVVSLSKFQ